VNCAPICKRSTFGIQVVRWLTLVERMTCPESADVTLDLDECCRCSELLLEYMIGVREPVFDLGVVVLWE
jgi:hypothetical protein